VTRGARSGFFAAVALAFVVFAPACIELSVDADAIGSIEFSAPSNPSLIVGDTLRDTLGVVEPLKARVYAVNGEEMTGEGVSFISADSVSSVVGAGLVVSKATFTGTSKLFASVGGLQSIVRSVEVIRRPDTLLVSGASRDTVLYRLPTSGTADDTSATVSFVVRSGATPVNAVRVSFELWHHGTKLSPSDTGVFSLLNSAGRASRVDTTDGSGVASRRLRVRTVAGAILNDSIEVRARATPGGSKPTLGPDSIVVLVRPATPP